MIECEFYSAYFLRRTIRQVCNGALPDLSVLAIGFSQEGGAIDFLPDFDLFSTICMTTNIQIHTIYVKGNI